MRGKTDNRNLLHRPVVRRVFLKAGATGAAGLILAACTGNTLPGRPAVSNEAGGQPAGAPPAEADGTTNLAQVLTPTPACDDHPPTVAQTAGPFYTPDTPERTNFREPGIEGTPLVVMGQVLTTDCQPIAGAVLDFWHCDAAGHYDNEGYRLRGHQFTDEDGVFRLETIVPGLYPGRTRHIHVKVQGPTTRLLTTQLYFPDEPQNARDRIFHPALVMEVEVASDGSQRARFDFVLV